MLLQYIHITFHVAVQVSSLESLMQQRENSCEQKAPFSKSSERLREELEESRLAVSELKVKPFLILLNLERNCCVFLLHCLQEY